MKANRYIAVIALFIAALTSGMAWAQSDIDGAERERILNKMREYKHKFLADELKLNKDQQREFFSVYDKMDDELQKINDETRELERRVNSDTNASETEVSAAAAAVYLQKQREGKVEAEYLERFRSILTPRQLLRLRSAEKDFTQKLVRQHRKVRSAQPEKDPKHAKTAKH